MVCRPLSGSSIPHCPPKTTEGLGAPVPGLQGRGGKDTEATACHLQVSPPLPRVGGGAEPLFHQVSSWGGGAGVLWRPLPDLVPPPHQDTEQGEGSPAPHSLPVPCRPLPLAGPWPRGTPGILRAWRQSRGCREDCRSRAGAGSLKTSLRSRPSHIWGKLRPRGRGVPLHSKTKDITGYSGWGVGAFSGLGAHTHLCCHQVAWCSAGF